MTKNEFNKLTQNSNPETVFFGDWHGDLSYALSALERVYEKYPSVEVLNHVGDFGLFPGNDLYLNAVSQSVEAAGKTLIITGGNHENWDQWDYWTSNNKKIFDFNNSGLIFLPKVYQWVQAGKSFASVGGASSIDRNWRREGISWWSQEEISPFVLAELKSKKLTSTEVLVTHESSNIPVKPIQARLDDTIVQAAWPQDAIRASELQRELVSDVLGVLKPNLHVHGHWHLPFTRKDEELTTASLGDNRTSYAENSFYYSW